MNVMQTFDFAQGETALKLRVELPAGLQQQFVQAPRSFSYTGALPADWKLRYFNMFLTHAADRPAVQAVLTGLRAHGAGDALLEVAVAFVQTAIAYDFKTAYQLTGGKIHYPSETLLDRKGVCADKTILLAALLQALGYRLAILSWDRANHMALGVAVPAGQGNFGEFAMIETTAPTEIGTVPERYAGGIKLDGKPEIVPIGGQQVYQGLAAIKQRVSALAQAYGADYLKMQPAQQAIHRQMHPLRGEIDVLVQQLKACKGNLAPAQFASCQALQNQHNAKVEAYNKLVAAFNAAK
jgi:hypothetical protein